MQKNKIDVVKAVCNSAVKRLAALSLAATVSCGAVACATPPKRNIPGLPSTTQGKENLQARLHELETKKSNTIQQFRERKEQHDKRLLQFEENGQQEDVFDRFDEDITWEEVFVFSYEMFELDRQINALRVQLGYEPLIAPVENVFGLVRVNEERGTVSSGSQNETVIDMSELSDEQNQQQAQQNQRQQYFGGSLNPFNWGFFGGGSK